jgi:hypothetical protein
MKCFDDLCKSGKLSSSFSQLIIDVNSKYFDGQLTYLKGKFPIGEKSLCDNPMKTRKLFHTKFFCED